jgi:hypothetical protein
MGIVRHGDNAPDLVLVDEGRAGVQVGDDRDAQTLERSGILDFERMTDERQTCRFDPCSVKRKRCTQSSDEGGDSTAPRGE